MKRKTIRQEAREAGIYSSDNKFTVMPRRLIAQRLGLSTERVSQLEKRALMKLRRHPIMQALAAEYGLQEDT